MGRYYVMLIKNSKSCRNGLIDRNLYYSGKPIREVAWSSSFAGRLHSLVSPAVRWLAGQLGALNERAGSTLPRPQNAAAHVALGGVLSRAITAEGIA